MEGLRGVDGRTEGEGWREGGREGRGWIEGEGGGGMEGWGGA